MAENVISRKQEPWMSVSVAPDVCKTPMGGSTPPVPYQVVSRMEPAQDASENVFANDGRVQKHDKTVMPTTEGDEPGTAKGVKSGTVGQQSWSLEHSPNVNANGKPVVRHDDKTEMNGDKKADDKEAKKKRYQCRKEQIKAGKESGDKDTQRAAERFERNNKAAEYAGLSEAAYGKEPPTGWREVKGEDLGKYGLTQGQLDGSRPGATHLYEPDADVFGNDFKPTVGFAGTGSRSDWDHNFAQAFGKDSSYYKDAVGIGNTLGSSVDYTGHSLGGGLASAASAAGGGDAWTFNAAGLNAGTVGKYGGTTHASDIQAYRVDNEPLTGLQEQGWKSTLLGGPGKVALSAALPDAVGVTHDLPASSWTPLGKHGMGDVKKGIEKQKQKDQKKIAAKTGKKC